MSNLLFVTALLVGISSSAQQFSLIQTNSENDIIPEGITIDKRTNTIFVSSINRHKILAIDEAGKTRNFVAESQDGFMEGLGMKVDEKNNLLWVSSIKKEDNRYNSKVHAFDLTSGKTRHQYALKDTGNHLLNDIIITSSGEIYLTDTYFGAIYKVDKEKNKLVRFAKDPLLNYPNGIEQLDTQRLVIATYSNGPVILDIKSQQVRKLPGAKDTAISKGLDGLVINGQKLYGVYNGADTQSGNAVIEYVLNSSKDSIVSEKIIDKGNKLFRDPTTTAYHQGKLYVVANSFLTEYNKNKTSTKGIEKQLKPVAILVYNVDSQVTE